MRLSLPVLLAASLSLSSAPVLAQADLAGVWRGTYECNQGTTGLTLTVQPGPGNRALFHFYSVTRNPQVPQGCFLMSVRYDSETRHAVLQAGPWLLQPPLYMTVDLDGTLSEDGTQLSGTVAGPGCSTFRLFRTAAHGADGPAACQPGQTVSGLAR